MDKEIEERTGDEIEGAYRRLCGAMLVQAAVVLSTRPANGDKSYAIENQRQREVARDWIDGAPAVLPFGEACDAVDMDEDYVRKGIQFAVDNRGTMPWQRRVAVRNSA
jgi:hypothetical protein